MKIIVKDLIYSSRIVKPQKPIVSPDFSFKSVVARSYWDYVEMFLRRNHQTEALFYWNQAENFYLASKNLNTISAPLTLYYCFLNATKALLTSKGLGFSKKHGVSGRVVAGNTNLKNEIINFGNVGILAELSRYFNDNPVVGQHSMWELLYNLLFVHRSFNLTYQSESVELFIPINNPRFIISDFQHYGWFCFETNAHHENKHTLNKLLNVGYSQDKLHKEFTVKFNKRFKWYFKGNKRANNLTRLGNYHSAIRKNLHYITSAETKWYIKRGGVNNLVERHTACIIYALMHRLSELARYEPLILSRHLELKQNWLLTEFIEGAAEQFIDLISCEITNSNISRIDS